MVKQKQTLEQFLREHKVLTKFKKNYEAYRKKGRTGYAHLSASQLIEEFKSHPRIIAFAFAWFETQEGWKYWCKLHYLFKDIHN